MLNWIYVDRKTFELKYGNRTQSKPHRVGSWGWTTELDEGEFSNEEEEAGGLLLDGDEYFVIVEPENGTDGDGKWEVRWDGKDDGLKGVEGIKGRKVLRVSLERIFTDEKPKAEGSDGVKTERGAETTTTSGTVQVEMR